MKTDLLEWIIEKLKLSDDEEVTDVKEEVLKTNKKCEHNKVYIKYVQEIKDCKDVIDEVKSGTVCIILLPKTEKEQSQFLINFLRGAAYSLEINMNDVGKSVYLVV